MAVAMFSSCKHLGWLASDHCIRPGWRQICQAYPLMGLTMFFIVFCKNPLGVPTERLKTSKKLVNASTKGQLPSNSWITQIGIYEGYASIPVFPPQHSRLQEVTWPRCKLRHLATDLPRVSQEICSQESQCHSSLLRLPPALRLFLFDGCWSVSWPRVSGLSLPYLVT